MMNGLALGLILTSLVTAGFFTTKNNPEQQDVIVKEGHRVVVVEYEKDAERTKVLISPHDTLVSHLDEGKRVVTNGEKKSSEKTADVKKKAEDVSSDAGEKIHHVFSPKEMVCDAYGKCKETLAGVIGKTKDKAYEVKEETEEKISDADQFHEAREGSKDSASEFGEKISAKAGEVKEGIKEELSRKAKAKEAEQGAETIRRKGEKELSEILRRAREVGSDVFEYTVPRGRLNLLASVLNLMGFSAAYGMCVWITFASSYLLARVLPRPQFAMVQSKIYPVYFKAMAYSLGLAFLGHLMNTTGKTAAKLQAINLTASLATIMVNLLHFEPLATKAMLEKMKKDKEGSSARQEQDRDSIAETAGRVSSGAKKGPRETTEEDAAAKSGIIKLRQDLRRLNSYSSALNVLILVSLTWYLVHLGQRIQC